MGTTTSWMDLLCPFCPQVIITSSAGLFLRPRSDLASSIASSVRIHGVSSITNIIQNRRTIQPSLPNPPSHSYNILISTTTDTLTVTVTLTLNRRPHPTNKQTINQPCAPHSSPPSSSPSSHRSSSSPPQLPSPSPNPTTSSSPKAPRSTQGAFPNCWRSNGRMRRGG